MTSTDQRTCSFQPLRNIIHNFPTYARTPHSPYDRRPDARVITIADLEAAIRDFYPQGLASQATRAANAAVSSLAEQQVAQPGSNSTEGERSLNGVPDERVTLCLRRLQGTRTVLTKTFKVAPGNLLFAVFRKACERLRLPENSVVFVHDGAILCGRREARTLASGPGCRSVQVFAVCKKDWACKQREAARRGFVSWMLLGLL